MEAHRRPTTEREHPDEAAPSQARRGSEASPKHDPEHGPERERRVEEEAEQRRSPSGKVVYRSVLKEAGEELERSSWALFWSGLAAGLSAGFSMVAEGVLRRYLPDAPWSPLIAKLGYAFGFLIVILGRQQLFTENTLTPMLPLLKHRDGKTLRNVMRLWGVVLAANLLGAAAFALVAARTPAFDSGVRAEFMAMGHEAVRHDFWTTMLRAVFAGWLIATLVWMLPYAEAAHFWIILAVTWLVGVAQFPHIVAGAVNVFTLAFAGQKRLGEAAGYYLIPTLIGNVIGGVTIVAALNHAQVNSGEE